MIVFGAVVLALSACGSSSGSGSSSARTSASTPTTATADSPAPTQAATGSSSSRTGLDSYAADVAAALDPKSAMFDYSKLMPTAHVQIKPDQSLAIVVASLASAQAVQFSNAAKAAAEAAGFTATVYDGKYSPQDQAAHIQRAVDNHVAGIVLAGITPTTVPSPIAAAAAAKIPVISMFGYGDQGNGVTDIGTDPALAGTSVGKWLVTSANEAAKAAIFQLPPGGAASVAINAYLDAMAKAVQVCGTCAVIRDSFQVSDALEVGTPRYAAFLNAHPAGTITHVASGFDSGMIAYAKADQALGRKEISTVGGFAASAAGVAEIKARTGPVVVPAVPLTFVAYASIDAIARRIAGTDVNNLFVQAPLITAQTADLYPDGVFTSGVDYANLFRTLWS
jgi:ABC-type sugar transport system substrate-binding protein